MRAHPLPVVMVSSLTERGCDATLRALELGALDFVTKPKIDVARGTAEVASEIVAKIKAAGVARVRKKVALPPAGAAAPVSPAARPATFKGTHRIIGIGASTGGTEALRELLCALPADSPAIVIVQHMPRALRARLQSGSTGYPEFASAKPLMAIVCCPDTRCTCSGQLSHGTGQKRRGLQGPGVHCGASQPAPAFCRMCFCAPVRGLLARMASASS